MSWVAQEFETLDLGDARLNKRAVLLAELELRLQPVAGLMDALNEVTRQP